MSISFTDKVGACREPNLSRNDQRQLAQPFARLGE
jgi:hypothetical protein